MSGEVSDLIIRWCAEICLRDIRAHSLAVNLAILQHSHKQLISLCSGHSAKWERAHWPHKLHTHTHSCLSCNCVKTQCSPAAASVWLWHWHWRQQRWWRQRRRRWWWHIGGGISQRHLHFLRTLNGQLTLILDFIWRLLLLLWFAADLT